ncbi:hypothetical protein [Bradyrhizobium sp. SZCCHNS3051]|uniref:nSTAND3 domain-containing NTPase n=1 Tax=Bradyrhizobium sp. SZCCHNS3051 TaxID=3057320 RepID=UPI002915F8F3|nr:hypothetical protein [Bradyrhizobium sp. SZCCHNS3051]
MAESTTERGTVSYNLTQLGWKSFQDLACAIIAEVLKRPVQTFLGSNDGGRDGAFLGTWTGKDGETAKSTIQCKFISKPDATLGLASLKEELPKAAKLAKQGLADDYVIVTNAGVSGEADAQICQAFQRVGVKTCRVLGGSWIIQQLTDNTKLRMLVPRVYGIGDLSHIITGHGYKQAKAILDSMGSDLSCFVPTEAYQQALRALHEHGFVILLGDPASGKSTIAAILALGALDDGCLGALKINAPDQISLWHPGEKQFLWVDDAFGPNQFDAARMSRWNAELGALRAAVEGGARIVFTSRNYIWEAARPHLKTSAFPPLKESQVVVNVHSLTADERAQMLYNHVRRAQSQKIRKRLKPFLAGVAANAAFIPETARRLGDPLFTAKLIFSEQEFTRLVEHPVEFLTEVIEQLDDASRAAIALIFLNSQSGVPSPIAASPALEMVTRLMGVQPADVSRAIQHLNDSLTRLTHQEDGPRWVFRHPTVTDAFAGIVAKSPELVELYVHGAKLDRLIQEAECQQPMAGSSYLRIPAQLYPSLVERLKSYPLGEELKSFLGSSCEKAFLKRMLEARTDILDWVAKVPASELSLGGKLLLAALASCKLMPEESRLRLVNDLAEDSIRWLNAKPLNDKLWQQLFTPAEFDDYAQRFRKQWLAAPYDTFDQLGRFSSDDEVGMYNDFKDNLKLAQRHFKIEEDEALSELYAQIDDHIENLEAYAPSQSSRWNAPPTDNSAKAIGTAYSIFFDVDD